MSRSSRSGTSPPRKSVAPRSARSSPSPPRKPPSQSSRRQPTKDIAASTSSSLRSAARRTLVGVKLQRAAKKAGEAAKDEQGRVIWDAAEDVIIMLIQGLPGDRVVKDGRVRAATSFKQEHFKKARDVTFRNCVFQQPVDFTLLNLPHSMHFHNCVFETPVSFTGCTWLKGLTLKECSFRDCLSFQDCHASKTQGVSFIQSQCAKFVDVSDCIFSTPVLLTAVGFQGGTNLSGRPGRRRGWNIAKNAGTLGQSTLHQASEHGTVQVIQSLLRDRTKLNLDLDQPNVDGFTAIELAFEAGHHNVVKLLEKSGAKKPRQGFDARERNNRDLLTAVADGNLETVTETVTQFPCDKNAPNQNGLTPLMIACSRGDEPIARVLIRAGAGTDDEDLRLDTPMHHCCRCCDFREAIRCAELLMSEGACTAEYNSAGELPLHDAVKVGNLALVQILARGREVLPWTQGASGESCIHLAARVHDPNLTALLLEYGDDVSMRNKRSEIPHAVALNAGNMTVAELLDPDNSSLPHTEKELVEIIKSGELGRVPVLLPRGSSRDMKKPNDDGRTLLGLAAGARNLAVMKHLLGPCAVPVDCRDGRGMTPLHIAVSSRHLPGVTMLLSAKADPCALVPKHCLTTLHLSAMESCGSIIKALLDVVGEGRKGDFVTRTSSSGDLALHLAAERGDVEVLTLLVKHGTQSALNRKNDQQRTPLICSILSNSFAASEFLASEQNIDLAAADASGNTAVHHACQLGQHHTVKMLLDLGVNITIQNKAFCSPLHLAVMQLSVLTCRLLLAQQHCGIDLRTESGESALHIAASRGSVELVQLLLQRGANASLCDSGGLTAAQVASLSQHQKIVQLLQRHKSDVHKFTSGLKQSPVLNKGATGIVRYVARAKKIEDKLSSPTTVTKGAATCVTNAQWDQVFKQAIEHNKVELAAQALSAGATPDLLMQNEVPALSFAAFQGWEPLLELLLMRKAQVDRRTGQDGKTALHFACSSSANSLSCVSRLVLLGKASTHLKMGKEELEPIHCAVIAAKEDVIHFLVTQRPECLHAKTGRGDSVLHLAARLGNLELIRTLVRRGADRKALNSKNKMAWELIRESAGAKAEATLILRPIDALRQHNEGFNTSRNSALQARALRVDLDDIPASKEDTSSIQAQQSHQVRIPSVELLQTLVRAVRAGDSFQIGEALARGAPAEMTISKGTPLLFYAVSCGKVRSTLSLLFGGASANRIHEGQTALAVAAAFPDQSISLALLRSLVEKGHADPNRASSGVDGVKLLPLHIAANNCNFVGTHYLSTVTEDGIHASSGERTTLDIIAAQSHTAEGTCSGCGLLELCIRLSPLSTTEQMRQFPQLEDAVRSHCMVPTQFASLDSLGLKPVLQACEAHLQTFAADSLADIYNWRLLIACGRNMCAAALQALQDGANINCCDRSRLTPLMLAAASGHDSIVQTLLERGADFNTVDEENCNAMHYGCRFQHVASSLSVVQMLYNAGTSPLQASTTGLLPLHEAVLTSNLEVVRFLLQHSPIAAQTVEGNSALHIAAQYSGVDMVSLLLHAKSDVGARNQNNCTASEIAAASGNNPVEAMLNQMVRLDTNQELLRLVSINDVDGVRAVLSQPCDVNCKDRHGFTPLMISARKGFLDLLQVLLAAEASLSATDNRGLSVLHHATENCEVLTYLVQDKQMDPDFLSARDGFSPLHMAVMNGRAAAVRFLLSLPESLARVNKATEKLDLPLCMGVCSSDIEIVSLLLQHGADPHCFNAEGVNAIALALRSECEGMLQLFHAAIQQLLSEAVREGRLREIEELAKTPHFDLNSHFTTGDFKGLTLLMIAARSGRRDSAATLIRCRAEVNQWAQPVGNAVHHACSCHDEQQAKEMVKVLAHVQADLSATCGRTKISPLIISSKRGSGALVQELLQHASVVQSLNVSMTDGNTALHAACKKGSEGVVALLLQAGANPMLRNEARLQPVQVAELHEHQTVASVLEEAMVKVTAVPACGHCGDKEHPAVWYCSQCFVECYCSEECQLAHSEQHQLECAMLQTADSRVTPQLSTLEILQTSIRREDLGGMLDILRNEPWLVEAKIKQGMTPLMLACSTSGIEVVETLLQHPWSAQVDATDCGGFTALHYAADRVEDRTADGIVRALTNANADIFCKSSNGGFAPIHCATIQGNHRVVHTLVSTSTGVLNMQTETGETPLHLAAAAGSVVLVQLFETSGADLGIVNAEGHVPLQTAAIAGHRDVVTYLRRTSLPDHIDPLADILETVIAAAEQNTPARLAACLELGGQEGSVEPESWRRSLTLAVQRAASVGNARALRQLLDFDPTLVDVRDSDGLSLLHVVCSFATKKHTRAARLILKHGANVRKRTTRDKLQPIHQACMSGSAELVELLIHYGAPIDTLTLARDSVMHCAAAGGSKDTILALLRHGAEFRNINISGDTPLQLALEAGAEDAAHVLQMAIGGMTPHTASSQRPQSSQARLGKPFKNY